MPPKEPQQVIYHGDFAPYNVALKGDTTIGIFDFDTAHPAPILWDVASAVYCWAPFKTTPNDALGNLIQQSTRAKLFCDSYNLSKNDRLKIVDTIILRIEPLLTFMFSEAKKRNQAFIANLQDKHHLSYYADIEYLEANKKSIADILC